jgi:hypothetical protein
LLGGVTAGGWCRATRWRRRGREVVAATAAAAAATTTSLPLMMARRRRPLLLLLLLIQPLLFMNEPLELPLVRGRSLTCRDFTLNELITRCCKLRCELRLRGAFRRQLGLEHFHFLVFVTFLCRVLLCLADDSVDECKDTVKERYNDTHTDDLRVG